MTIPCASCFNAMALIISCLLRNADVKSLEEYMAISSELNEGLNKFLANEFPELYSTELKIYALYGEKGNLLLKKIPLGK